MARSFRRATLAREIECHRRNPPAPDASPPRRKSEKRRLRKAPRSQPKRSRRKQQQRSRLARRERSSKPPVAKKPRSTRRIAAKAIVRKKAAVQKRASRPPRKVTPAASAKLLRFHQSHRSRKKPAVPNAHPPRRKSEPKQLFRKGNQASRTNNDAGDTAARRQRSR